MRTGHAETILDILLRFVPVQRLDVVNDSDSLSQSPAFRTCDRIVKFVLADEPTANLDSKAATTLLEIMEKLNHESKITFIFSTHDPRVVKMAHRVITLEDGKVITDDIRELPA